MVTGPFDGKSFNSNLLNSVEKLTLCHILVLTERLVTIFIYIGFYYLQWTEMVMYNKWKKFTLNERKILCSWRKCWLNRSTLLVFDLQDENKSGSKFSCSISRTSKGLFLSDVRLLGIILCRICPILKLDDIISNHYYNSGIRWHMKSTFFTKNIS